MKISLSFCFLQKVLRMVRPSAVPSHAVGQKCMYDEYDVSSSPQDTTNVTTPVSYNIEALSVYSTVQDDEFAEKTDVV